jgi:LPXTG-motif cell wall-anchored protein
MPGGWVVAGQSVAVNGSKHVQLRGTRPLSEGLAVTAKFDEGPYRAGDTATLTVSLTNNGPREAKNIVAICDIDREEHLVGTEKPANWGVLATGGDGVTLKAGEAVTLKVHGTVPQASLDHGVVFVRCEFRDKNSSAAGGNPFVFTLAKVPGRTGTGAGLFFHDKDLDNNADKGEPGVGSLPVTLLDPLDGKEIGSTTTAADGRYRVAGLPAGWYIAVPRGPWTLKNNEFFVVKAGDKVDERDIALVPGPLRVDLGSLPKPPAPPDADSTPESRNESQNRTLANTGANVIGLTVGGVVVLLLGAGTVLATRRRRRG